MFLFCLFWNFLLIGEGSKFFSTNPLPVLSIEASTSSQIPPLPNRKRKPPGNPDPNSEVLSLSPETLLATHRFTCEICQKGFQREQNLHLHLRKHKIFHKLKQRSQGSEIRKRVYICPEPTCIHHNHSRALGDLTGIKKHFSRKHGEKNLRCEKCSKTYALLGDWTTHSKTCGTPKYKCECGTTFSSRNSFIAHRDLCVPLTYQAPLPAHHQEPPPPPPPADHHPFHHHTPSPAHHPFHHHTPSPAHHQAPPTPPTHIFHHQAPPLAHHQAPPLPPAHDPFLQIFTRLYSPNPNLKPVWGPPAINPRPSQLSATTILRKAGCIRSHPADHVGSSMTGSHMPFHFVGQFEEPTTLDFSGLNRGDYTHGGGNLHNGTMSGANVGLREVLNFTQIDRYEDELTLDGEGGDFLFAPDPTWK